MTFPVCPCDDDTPVVPVNLPELNHIAFRFGTYAEFRRAVLTPVAGEQSLTAWRPQGQGDLAVMMAEWFAYLGDILTFYDERIANGLVRSSPFDEVETTPNQLRWDPLPLPTKPTDFIDGLTTPTAG